MHIGLAILGVLGLLGTGIWVRAHSQQKQQLGPQGYWYRGLIALLPAWLLGFMTVLTPPPGQEAFVVLPIADIMAIGAGLLGVILTDWAVRHLSASGRAPTPMLAWLLGVVALLPAWCVLFVNLVKR